MSLQGVVIEEGNVGANVGGDSREFGLVGNGVAVAGKLTLGVPFSIRRPADAVAYGIDAAYDSTNSVNIYRHIQQFYRKKANLGKVLNIVVVAQTVMPSDMVDAAKGLTVFAKGMISDMGFVFNPAVGYTETVVNGVNEDVTDAITELQAFAMWCRETNKPLHCILECRGMGDTVSAAPNLRSDTFAAPKVTLVAGQDWSYADSLGWALGKKLADVGTFLGVIASQKFNENPGETATQNLYDKAQKEWLVAGLSNHKTLEQMWESLDTLDGKGYVIPVHYEGWTGVFWNDGHTCVPIVIDSTGKMNLHTTYYSHTYDQAHRSLRIAYIPELKKTHDLENGLLPQTGLDFFKSIGDDAFEALANKGLISSGSTDVDPASDLLIEKKLKCSWSVVPTGMVGSIEGELNLKSQ